MGYTLYPNLNLILYFNAKFFIELFYIPYLEISREDSRPARCGLELDKGSGAGKDRPRYFYNKATKQCEEFTYKGYEGNANNFKRKVYCESMCQGKSKIILN